MKFVRGNESVEVNDPNLYDLYERAGFKPAPTIKTKKGSN